MRVKVFRIEPVFPAISYLKKGHFKRTAQFKIFVILYIKLKLWVCIMYMYVRSRENGYNDLHETWHA